MFVFISALRRETAGLDGLVKAQCQECVDGARVIEGYAEGTPVVIVHSGIGRERSQAAARMVIRRYRPDALVSIGFSGGVTTDIKGGDLVLGDRLVSVSLDEGNGGGLVAGPEIRPDIGLLHGCMDALEEGLMPARRGCLASVPTVVSGRRDRELLGRKVGAVLVDMESYWVGQVCQEAEVPFLAARVASDEVGDVLPDYPRFMNDLGDIRPARAAWYFVTHPHHLLATPVLAANTTRGVRNLAAFSALFLTTVNRGAPVRR